MIFREACLSIKLKRAALKMQKRVAVAFAVSQLFDNSDGFRPQLLSQMLPWKQSG